jgi:hypothetical protein
MIVLSGNEQRDSFNKFYPFSLTMMLHVSKDGASILQTHLKLSCNAYLKRNIYVFRKVKPLISFMCLCQMFVFNLVFLI